MILYHGSEFIIDKPRFNGGKPYNDYGQGFYCTEYFDMAKEWSVASDRNGYVNTYELDAEGLSILNLNDHSMMEWLAILLSNRTFDVSAPLAKEAKEYIQKEFLPDFADYDLIVGYRADDSYFSFAQDFISGVISYEQLREAMYLGNLGNQVVLKSKKSFERILFTGYEKVSSEEWFPKREARDKKARNMYFDMDKHYVKGSLYVTGILDMELKRDDYRLR